MSDIYEIAAQELGTKEYDGKADNPNVLKYSHETGLNFRGDHVHWCSAFVNWCAMKTGLERTDSAMARSWLTVGEKIDINELQRGDIIIMLRGKRHSDYGHVCIFKRFSSSKPSHFVGLGGNQSDAVTEDYQQISKIIGCRRLRPIEHKEIKEEWQNTGEQSKQQPTSDLKSTTEATTTVNSETNIIKEQDLSENSKRFRLLDLLMNLLSKLLKRGNNGR